eukprot:1071088-Alexandrium_andersonii.AAC.1
MSASLVGSEMCIRDSHTLGAGRVQIPLSRWGFAGSKSLLRQLPAARSVSYTHLTLPTICSV